MKQGDLVRRGRLWTEWIKKNKWMEDRLASEIGIVIKIDKPTTRATPKFQTFIVVLWSDGIHSWEDPEDLEVFHEAG